MDGWQRESTRCQMQKLSALKIHNVAPAKSLFCFDVGLANDPAVFIVLFAQNRTEIHAAHPNRIELLAGKFHFDLGYLQCRDDSGCRL